MILHPTKIIGSDWRYANHDAEHRYLKGHVTAL